jgi:GWxTD domain-containing protein
MTVPHASVLRVARSPRGARVRFGLVLASIALLLATSGARAAREQVDPERLPLPWRVEGRTGFTVDAVGFPDSAGTRLDVYVRIPPSTLENLARDEAGNGILAISVRLRIPTGARLAERRQELPFSAADTAGGFGKVVVMRFTTRPGQHQLEVKLVDVQSHKIGLAYVGRKAQESAAARGTFEVPKPQGGREMSGLEFVWSEMESGTAAFRHAGRTLAPNPERLYGLYSGDLMAYFTARPKPGDERPWHWVARVLDDNDTVVAAQESTGVAGPLDAACVLDVSTQPAGGYDLEVKAWQQGDSLALVRRARFSIAWKPASWTRDPLDVSDDVHLLLEGSDEEERFAALHPGEREHVLDEFWKKRDPSPETAQNEALATFRARVARANELYTQPGRQRGMFTDMGRTFIRYGEPTEIDRQVIPTGDETVQQVLHTLEITEDHPSSDTRPDAAGNDQRPFEVWIYDAPVPMPIEADPTVDRKTRHTRLIFVFVDEQGVGHYTLRYSTE